MESMYKDIVNETKRRYERNWHIGRIVEGSEEERMMTDGAWDVT